MQVQRQDALPNILFARFYSNQTARFLSVDPVTGSKSAPQSWNRYAYVRSNPIKYFDPDGENVKLAEGLSRKDKKRLIRAIARANRNADFSKKLNTLEQSGNTVTLRTSENLQNDFETNPKASSGTVKFGQTDETFDSTGAATGSDVKIDFTNIEFSQRSTQPVTDVETVAHEIDHADNIENGVPASTAEENAAVSFGKAVDADPKSAAKTTRKERKAIKNLLKN